MPHLLALILLIAILGSPARAALPSPSAENVQYDTQHPRNVLDFWAAKPGAKLPAPVIVWFHGGAFRKGDKTSMRKRGSFMFEAYRDAGYAIVSCNYPFLDRRGGMDYGDIVRHCARAVRFVRSKAEAWKIDPDRLCAGGASAGALISESLAYGDGLDTGLAADDPTAGLHSRPQVVISHLQPIGTRDFALRHMDAGEAPIFIYSNAPKSDRIHPPGEAVKLRDRARELDIPCVALSSGRNDLPQAKPGTNWLQTQLEFCKTHLNSSKSGKKRAPRRPAESSPK